MRVEALALEDFRNYRRVDIELAEELNLVIGRNAQGKTNLLEGIHCLSGLGSPRAPDAALVRAGAERALVHGRVARGSRVLQVDLELRPGRGSRALVNRTPVSGARGLGEVTTTVFFGPDELSLIKGSPEGRRRFLDDLVVKLRPARDGLRKEWERVLRQRNALLKTMPRSGRSGAVHGTLEVWDESLCRIGAALGAARLEALGALTPHARRRYTEIAGGGALALGYVSSWVDEDACTAALEDPGGGLEPRLGKALADAVAAARSKEIERGVSLVGPQRDDVAVRLSSHGNDAGSLLEARSFASQGDQRTAALALKLAESDLITATLGQRPVLLLDDVFSELDPARRSWLAGAVRGLGQVLLSSAEPGAVDAAGADLVVEVEAGRLSAHG
ncbi:MAG: DNA replication/repair protein RecF [Actinomycetota bacterium]